MSDEQQPRRGGLALLRRRRQHERGAPAPDRSDAPPARRPRAALVINPYSSGMTSRREREIVTLLRDACEVEVLRTQRAGHASELARHAAAEDVDVVIACGGDGTGNEVLNGLGVASGTAKTLPRFALVPAGGTNVLSRSVGLPNNPIAATRTIIEALAADRSTEINLGKLDERIFMFSAGMGFDGEIMRQVDARRRGRRPSDFAHLRIMVGTFASERWAFQERMTITIDDTGEQLRACLLMVGNTTPMTYLGRLGMHFMPDCRIDQGLDLLAPTHQSAAGALRNTARALGAGRRARLEGEQARHDLSGFTVECDEPQPCQVDGEYIGERTHVRFDVLERCIRYVY